jgi:sec-independent protein translocase protein TatC
MLKSTVALKKSDDLFEKSSMSFGEHLEELRKSLIRASICLMAGLFIGIPSANYVIEYLQTPLKAALEKFYEEKSLAEMAKSSGEEVTPELRKWVIDNKKQSSVIFFDLKRLKSILAELLESPPLPAEDASDDEKNAAAKERLELQKRMTNADSLGLPNPNQLVAVRTFIAIEAQSEALSFQEPVFIWFKAALLVAVVIASPGIFYYVWGFVAAGLYPHERRYVYLFLPSSLALFLGGAGFAFFFVFELVIGFLLQFNTYMGVGTSPRLNDYMSFALMLPLGFGIAFQLPLVMLVIERLGIVSVKTYLEQWRMAVFIIALVSMILTPADWYSMVAMAVPLTILYFFGIGLCRYLPRSTMMSGKASDPR